MPRLEVRVDGNIRYEGDVPESYLPQQPSMYPRALGVEGRNVNPPPLAKVTALTAALDMVRQAFEAPPLNCAVEIETNGMGRMTMTVEMPLPVVEEPRGPIAL